MLNDVQRRKSDKLSREDVFITENAADFPASSPVAVLTEQINVERQKIAQYAAEKESGYGDRRQAQEIYDARRDELIDLLDLFQLAADIVDDDIEGTAAKFKNRYPRTDQLLIARATSFYNDSAPLRAELSEAGATAEKRERLLGVRDEFQQAAAAHDAGEERHSEATGGLIESFHTAMELSSRRDKRVKMKYRDNAAKLAAWKVASHLDRAPKRRQETTTPTA
jgi:hypothetical protein